MRIPALIALAALAVAAEGHPPAAATATPAAAPDARASLERLLAGNRRFVADTIGLAHRDAERRTEVAAGQHPFAIVVCCSDSRVPPEQVFDVGIGDIFVVRTAGNVIDAIGMGSIEYAVEHLHVPLIVVLGHERCGAVTAALGGGDAPGHVLAVVEAIQRNLAGARPAAGDAVEQAMRINAGAVARSIADSRPILAEAVEKHGVRVVAARYDLDDGTVEPLP